MSDTKYQPILSDENLRDAVEVNEIRYVPEEKLFRFREIYEAELQSLRDRVAKLEAVGDAIDEHLSAWDNGGTPLTEARKAWHAAKQNK